MSAQARPSGRRSRRTWVISDLHLGDPRVARARGFASADEMDLALAERWSERVGRRDRILVLGDVARRWENSERLLSVLPGIKHLVYGNHDSGHPMHVNQALSPAEARVRWKAARSLYTREVFSRAADFDLLPAPGSPARSARDAQYVLLYHLPYAGQFPRGKRFDPWRPRDLGSALIHGHEHDPEPAHRLYLSTASAAPCFNAVPDANEWAPYDIEEILTALAPHIHTRAQVLTAARESLAASGLNDKSHRSGRGAARRRKRRLRALPD